MLFWSMRTVHLNPGFKVSKLCAFNLMIFKIKVHLSSLEASETPPLRSLLGIQCRGAGLGPGVCIPQASRWASGGTGRSTWPTALLLLHWILPTVFNQELLPCLPEPTQLPLSLRWKVWLRGNWDSAPAWRAQWFILTRAIPAVEKFTFALPFLPHSHIENMSVLILNFRAEPLLFWSTRRHIRVSWGGWGGRRVLETRRKSPSLELNFPSTAKLWFSILWEADGITGLAYCLLFYQGPAKVCVCVFQKGVTSAPIREGSTCRPRLELAF